MWFFRHFWIFISYHIFLLNQVEGAIAIPPSNSAPLPLFCPSVCPSVCPSIGLLTTFSGFCTFTDKSLGRNGIELEMQMFPDDLPLANIDADGYCCHFMRSSVRPTIHGLGFVYFIQSAWKKWPPVREILIKFLIINSWGKYEEMLWNPTNVSSHKKTHITIILYVEIRSSWGKYEELAQYLARNISHEEYSSQGFRPNPRTNISSQGIKNLWGIFLARNIPREK